MTRQQLNRAQRAAVEHQNGPLLVLAGAGTGKTRVVTHRIANLVRHGVPPARILAVTFTNRAAEEMRQRIAQLVRLKPADRPLVCTFHSLCVGILRQEHRRLGLPKRFSIYDRADQESVARSALRQAGVDPAEAKPAQLLAAIGRWKTLGLRADRASDKARSNVDRLLASAYRRYEQTLNASAVLDFDDLLLTVEELFRDHPGALADQQARFDHILVDEYQDTSPNQFRIVRLLAQSHQNLCVVGDDDQSIYGWRGADVGNILRFEQDFPCAKIVRLEENYRSCPSILTLANQLIQHNAGRHQKELRASRSKVDEVRLLRFPDEVGEADGVAQEIRHAMRRPGRRFGDFAVLFRTNEQPRVFEQQLRARQIPYVLVGGYSFFDRKEVRDVLAYLKVLANPADESSLLRILNVPPRGLGSTAGRKIMQRAVATGKPLWDVLPEFITGGLAPLASASLAKFVALNEKFRRQLAAPPIASTVARLLDELDYRAEIARNHPDDADRQSRWESVGELVNMIARFERSARDPSLTGFLEWITLDSRDNDADRDHGKDAVTLITLHSAKGLEFPEVYLVGMEVGLLPHKRSAGAPLGMDEERRLAYVGITRARDRLTLTRATSRLRFGQARKTEPSPFLFEMLGRQPPDPSETPARPRKGKRTRASRRP